MTRSPLDEAPGRFTAERRPLIAEARTYVAVYAAEHHAYPAVPGHALPRLHERIEKRIANLEPGYLAATAKVNRCPFGAARAERAEASRRPSNHDRPHT